MSSIQPAPNLALEIVQHDQREAPAGQSEFCTGQEATQAGHREIQLGDVEIQTTVEMTQAALKNTELRLEANQAVQDEVNVMNTHREETQITPTGRDGNRVGQGEPQVVQAGIVQRGQKLMQLGREETQQGQTSAQAARGQTRSDQEETQGGHGHNQVIEGVKKQRQIAHAGEEETQAGPPKRHEEDVSLLPPAKRLKTSSSTVETYACSSTTRCMPRNFFNEFPLKVVVGPEQEIFHVNKSVICEVSHFFRAACSEDWESGRTNTVALDDSSADAFHAFATWITRGKLNLVKDPVKYPDNDTSKTQNHKVARGRYSLLISCYFLGDFLQAPLFMDRTMDALECLFKTYFVAHVKTLPTLSISVSDLERVYTNTIEYSPLRKCVVTQFVRCSQDANEVLQDLQFKQSSFSHGGDWRQDCISDLLRKVLVNTSYSKIITDRSGRCNYHEHTRLDIAKATAERKGE